MKARKAIVLDWDGVIFDDDQFKETLFQTLMTASGLTYEEVEEQYKATKDQNGYNDWRLAKSIAKVCDKRPLEIKKVIHQVMDRVSVDFIYNDARDFIKDALKNKMDVLVLTAGNRRIQTHKILSSRLDEHFFNVVVVPANNTEIRKEKALRRIIKQYDQIFFYDDKLSTIIHLHEEFRHITALVPIWVNRLDPTSYKNAFSVDQLSFEKIHTYSNLYAQDRTLISALVVRNAQGDLLMVQEEKGRGKGMWTIPIGHVEDDQLFLEAAIREAEEETGYEVSVSNIRGLIGVNGVDYLSGDRDQTRSIIIVTFEATLDTEMPTQTNELTFEWLDASQISKRKLRGEWQVSLH